MDRAIMRSIPLFVALLVACHPGYYSISSDGTRSAKYSRINEYTEYGLDGLGAQAKVARVYEAAQHAPPPNIDVEIYNATLPAGVTITSDIVHIDDNAPYEGVGRFEIGYWRSAAPDDGQIGDDLKRLAAATNSNVAIVTIVHWDHGDTRVDHVKGLLLRKHPVEKPKHGRVASR